MGFDGFVDYLIHPVKTRKDEKTCEYFPTIDQFGEKITSLAGRSGNIELIMEKTDFGGCNSFDDIAEAMKMYDEE